MKKTFLFLVMAIITLSFVACDKNPVFGKEMQGVITGRLSHGGICPPDYRGTCLDLGVMWIINDDGIFALVGTSDDFPCSWEGLSLGDEISIYGTYVKWKNSAYDFHRVTVFSRIIREEDPVYCEEIQGVITGRLSSGGVCPPDYRGVCITLGVPWVINDDGIFALVGISDDFSCSWEGLSSGDEISIFGTYVKGKNSAYDFYRVTVSRIIR
jgi:hypothetical protein